MMIKKCFPIQFLCQILISSILIPFPVLGAATKPQTKTVALISTNSDQTGSNDEKLFYTRLRERLSSIAHVLPIQDVQQLSLQTSSKDPKLSEALDLMNTALDDYSNFSTTEHETLSAMDVVTNFIQSSVTPSQQSSEIMMSALMTKAWLLHKSGQRNKAEEILTSIRGHQPKNKPDFSYYPPNFRKYAEHFFADQNSAQNRNTKFTSIPSGASVFIDHIHVGETPMELHLGNPSEIQVGFAIPGRKTIVKSSSIKPNGQTQIKATLPWDSKEKNQNILTKSWNSLNPKQKIIFAGELSASAKSDQIIVFDETKTEAGILPQATVYDARYSQLMKVIPYPHAIPRSQLNKDEVVSFFAKKLSPYIHSQSITYWQSQIDRNVILDHRIASRGKKPLSKKAPFWIAGAGVVLAGVITAVVLSSSGGSGSSDQTGGVAIDFNNL